MLYKSNMIIITTYITDELPVIVKDELFATDSKIHDEYYNPVES